MAEADFTLVKNNVREAQAERESTPVARRAMDAAGLISFLWERMDADKAGDADLEWLSEATDRASVMAQNLGESVSGIGCLIAEDCFNGREGGTRSGALQDDDLPSLLFSVADTLQTISAMTFIGSEAEFKLRDRLAMRLRTAA
ncbi:hypothetical protein [Ralstonia solanacearum]|uniref:hypothetical protein n=1 Tax=Ralstonia solanacearum TaxID=305 RepID=UPI0005ABFB59|nr:hypothetical protein [Ralstonia solanacearum]MDC6177537.1 hypothetical protein [Ralstonia solanacearum]MDC6240922.1 hypothetical protein [Ralstonia solanacearum]